MRRSNMQAERARAGITAREAASAIGVSQNAYLRWESGKARPLSTNLIKLASLYGCSVDYLLGITDERNVPIR